MTSYFSPVSIGDLAQSLVLRRSNTSAQDGLMRLTADLAVGSASDPGRHLAGHLSPLAALDGDIARTQTYARASSRAATQTAAMQAALARVDDLSTQAASTLIRAGESRDPGTLALASDAAQGAFASAVSALNTRVAGHSLFAASASDQPALSRDTDILAAARLAIGPAASPSDIETALDSWLNDPTGFEATAWRGGGDILRLPVAPGEEVRIDATARDPRLHSTFKGLILGALLADTGFGGDTAARADLSRRAGLSLMAGSEGRADIAAQLGQAEARIDLARTRATAEQSALSMARNDLLAIDLPDTVARLNETESRIQMLYALTSRLSRLSMADYL